MWRYWDLAVCAVWSDQLPFVVLFSEELSELSSWPPLTSLKHNHTSSDFVKWSVGLHYFDLGDALKKMIGNEDISGLTDEVGQRYLSLRRQPHFDGAATSVYASQFWRHMNSNTGSYRRSSNNGNRTRTTESNIDYRKCQLTSNIEQRILNSDNGLEHRTLKMSADIEHRTADIELR